MKIYIIADIEGVAGEVFYEHCAQDMSPLAHDHLVRNRVLLTEEVNAAARGAFDAGAETVVVHDHHGCGYNIMPELMDKRLELIHGRADENLTMRVLHPDLDESVDAILLVGMHPKAGTKGGGTPHSLICVRDAEGHEHELSEATMSIAAAGDYDVPCAFISGDRAVVEDALQLVPGMANVVTKKHYAPQLARTIAPELARERIRAGVREGLARFEDIAPFRIPGPCTIQVADRDPAARWPEDPRTLPTFREALMDTLLRVPWYKPIEKMDDGWRYPDRMRPTETPNDRWNEPAKGT